MARNGLACSRMVTSSSKRAATDNRHEALAGKQGLITVLICGTAVANFFP